MSTPAERNEYSNHYLLATTTTTEMILGCGYKHQDAMGHLLWGDPGKSKTGPLQWSGILPRGSSDTSGRRGSWDNTNVCVS